MRRLSKLVLCFAVLTCCVSRASSSQLIIASHRKHHNEASLLSTVNVFSPYFFTALFAFSSCDKPWRPRFIRPHCALVNSQKREGKCGVYDAIKRGGLFHIMYVCMYSPRIPLSIRIHAISTHRIELATCVPILETKTRSSTRSRTRVADAFGE
jgi:hypothetical protein